MDSIISYMKNSMWKDDLKFERKMYLRQLAKKSSKRTNIASKIGGMLIYNQLIEECLKDLVEYSAYYIKATMWPTQIDLSFDLIHKGLSVFLIFICRKLTHNTKSGESAFQSAFSLFSFTLQSPLPQRFTTFHTVQCEMHFLTKIH